MNERREGESQENDRRMIERFTNSSVRSSLQACSKWVKVISGALLVGAALVIGIGVFKGATGMTSSVLTATFLFLFSILLFRYDRAINLYLNNESVANLEKSMEAQMILFMTIGIFSILALVVYSVFSF